MVIMSSLMGNIMNVGFTVTAEVTLNAQYFADFSFTHLWFD